MEAVALWVNRKPNKEFDLQMTGCQEVLFWYERTIISLQFFINLIRRKYFRIQANMSTGNENPSCADQQKSLLVVTTGRGQGLKFFHVRTSILLIINVESFNICSVKSLITILNKGKVKQGCQTLCTQQMFSVVQ